MKKLLLSIFAMSSFAASAQLTVFEDSFETYDDFLITGFGDWITLDIDGLNTYTGGTTGDPTWANAGDPQAWQIFNPATALVTNDETGASGETRNFDPHTGAKFAASWAAADAGGAPVNNDFLVSPVLNLGASANELTFWVKSMSDSYGLEQYRVYVYVGTGVPTGVADFTQISGLTALEAPYPTWEEKIYSLDAYSNQAIRVGIRNVGADHYMLMVDDFKVTSANLAVNDVLANKFSTYPNPATNVINVTNAEGITVNAISMTDLNGRVVKQVNFTDAPSDIQVNVSDLSSGMYMMNISSDAGTTVRKFVKN